MKNAQEAHEAIRPTNFNLTPSQLEGSLDGDELRIYELIWKRAVASQMADAKMLRTTVEITGETNDGAPVTFNASGNAIEFAGFLRAYVEGSDDPAAALDEQETLLPKLAVGDQVGMQWDAPAAPPLPPEIAAVVAAAVVLLAGSWVALRTRDRSLGREKALSTAK